MNIFQTGIQP